MATTSPVRRFPGIAELQRRIGALLAPATSAKSFWVRAELNGLQVSGRGVYCDLVEMAGGKVLAKVRCYVSTSDHASIMAKLRAAGIEDLFVNGNEVALQVRVQYHAVYALSVVASDIDVDASLGALEAKRLLVLATLEREGLIGRNALVAEPTLPLRIGLIASAKTAAFADFIQTLRGSGFAFCLFHADARVQGEDTERSILRAFQHLGTLGVDIVVLIRGGGSRIDLSHLDSEPIARAIAVFPRPVWTGIGHETDDSVLDAVAARYFKTPTAVAEELVGRLVREEHRLAAAAKRLRSIFDARLSPERRYLVRVGRSVASHGANALERKREAIVQRRERLALGARGRAGQERRSLDHRTEALLTRPNHRIGVAQHSLIERRKSLHKTSGRALERAIVASSRSRERLLSGRVASRIAGEQLRIVNASSRTQRHIRDALLIRRGVLERAASRARSAAGRVRLEMDRQEQRSKSLVKTAQRALAREAERSGSRSSRFAAARALPRIVAQRERIASLQASFLKAGLGTLERRRSELYPRAAALKTTSSRFRYEATLLLRHQEVLRRQSERILALGSLARSARASAFARIETRLQQRLAEAWNRLESQRRLLDAADPQHVLTRGFALLYDGAGKLVRGVEWLRRGDAIRAVL